MSRCHHQRSMRERHLFCPWCGLRLEVWKRCPTCKQDFFTEQSFIAHETKAIPICPKCKSRKLAPHSPARFTCLTCGEEAGARFLHQCPKARISK